MNDPVILLVLLHAAVLFAVFVPFVFIPRIRTERRARRLSARYPDAERASVYLTFRSVWPSRKQQEMDAKISEMSVEGWIFLRATEVNHAAPDGEFDNHSSRPKP